MFPKSPTLLGYHKAKDCAGFGSLCSELWKGQHPAQKKPYYKHKRSFDLSFRFGGGKLVRKGPHMERQQCTQLQSYSYFLESQTVNANLLSMAMVQYIIPLKHITIPFTAVFH